VTKRSLTARPYADRVPRQAVGPLATTVLSECACWLATQGYSPGSAAGVVNLLERLSLWMRDVDADIDDLDESLLVRFVAAEQSRPVVCVAVKNSMGTMRRFLNSAGYLRRSKTDVESPTSVEDALDHWRGWMRDERGLTEKTIAAHCRYAAGLLDVVTPAQGPVGWGRVDVSVVNAYVTERGRPYGVAARAHIVDSVRCLLRWALSTGRLDRDLTAGILKARGTRRALPRGVTAEQVTALLAACDPATALGARDLADIDWAGGRLKITGKGREHVLPLPVDVGQALEAWLRLRPASLDRAVFVRTRAPHRMMTTSGISGVIARVSDQAAIDRIYAHRLRHTAAMNVLAAGGTLTEAKELLGHVYTVTTMAYAKVDLTSLRELVVPFGQVPR
jgi:site-specific recombinase XerC